MGAIGRAIRHTIESITGWAFAQMINALQSTTAIHLSGWFSGPWRAMASVAVLLALPLLLVGVAHEVLAGNPLGALQRGLLMPLLVGVGLVAAPALLAGLLAIVDAMCAGLVQLGIGGPQGFGHALANMQHLLGAASADPSTTFGLPGPVSFLLLLVVGVLAFVIWIELALRTALVYLLAIAIPLAAAGLFWRNTVSWTRRTLDLLLAVALSKVIITAVMVLAAAAIGDIPTTASGAVDTLATGIALLLLGTFALPMTMRLVPHVSEAAFAAGAGALATQKVRSGARTVGMTVAATSGATGVGLAGAALAGPASVARLAATRRGALSVVPAAKQQPASAAEPRRAGDG
jgi:hypothetical protein